MLRVLQPSATAVIAVLFALLAVRSVLVREMEIKRQVQTVVVRSLVAVTLLEILHRLPVVIIHLRS